MWRNGQLRGENSKLEGPRRFAYFASARAELQTAPQKTYENEKYVCISNPLRKSLSIEFLGNTVENGPNVCTDTTWHSYGFMKGGNRYPSGEA